MKLLDTAEKREALLDAMIMNAMDAFIVIDVADVVHLWSPEAQKIFGWTQDEALGKCLSHLVMPPEAQKMHLQVIKTYQETGAHRILNRRFEFTALHRNGERLPIEVTVTPIHLGDQLLFGASIRDLSEKKKTEQTLLKNQKDLNTAYEEIHKSRSALEAALTSNRRLMDHSPDVICALDNSTHFVQVSNASERVWGYCSEELVGRKFVDFVHVDDRVASLTAAEKIRSGSPDTGFENRFIHKNGGIAEMEWTMNWCEEDRTFYCVARDITCFKKSAYELAERDQRFKSLFEHHPDGVFAFDMEGRLLSANEAFSMLTGYSSQELISMSFPALMAKESAQLVEDNFQSATRGVAADFEAIGVRKDGSRYEARLTTVPIIVHDRVMGVHGIARDITHSRNYERRIEYLATFDALTGLPNRNLLDDRLRHAIAQAERLGYWVAVLFLDLNRFKIVNDSLGHDEGDELLQITGNRLRNCIREADTVGRLGGDEFVVVLENVSTAHDVIVVARNLLAEIEKPVVLGGHEFIVTASIGCSLFPKDSQDPAGLMRAADLAMYEAKSVGGGAFRLYRADMSERVKSRLLHEHQLRRALERNELVVYYQPRVDITTGRIVGAEALVRWQHPERGLVPPNEFIPLAEEIGLIDDLGLWVLRMACRQNRIWQMAGLPPLKVSVNLSPQQLAPESSITDLIRRTLEETDLEPKWLELEITETSLMQNMDSTLSKLVEIRDSGVSISIDDFGTGYSSLSYLRRLPVNALKIDQSFIREISANRDNAAIVSATIALAHTMELKVVAEGVTTEEQVSFLRSHDCDELQGFLLSPAVPVDDLSRMLHLGGSLFPGASLH